MSEGGKEGGEGNSLYLFQLVQVSYLPLSPLYFPLPLSIHQGTPLPHYPILIHTPVPLYISNYPGQSICYHHHHPHHHQQLHHLFCALLESFSAPPTNLITVGDLSQFGTLIQLTFYFIYFILFFISYKDFTARHFIPVLSPTSVALVADTGNPHHFIPQENVLRGW